jgi:hypothetical protein
MYIQKRPHHAAALPIAERNGGVDGLQGTVWARTTSIW